MHAGVEGEAVVALGEIPTSGYRWRPSALPRGVSLEESKFTSGSDERVAGGGGRRELHFRADRPGTYDLEIELRREWEEEAIEKRQVRLVFEKS